jgi:hypothetical protein
MNISIKESLGAEFSSCMARGFVLLGAKFALTPPPPPLHHHGVVIFFVAKRCPSLFCHHGHHHKCRSHEDHSSCLSFGSLGCPSMYSTSTAWILCCSAMTMLTYHGSCRLLLMCFLVTVLNASIDSTAA